MSKLKDFREQNTILSQKGLADLADINLRTLQDYEQGRKSLNSASTTTVLKIAMALDTDVANIIDYDDIRDEFLNNLTNMLVEIEIDPGSHDDYLEDYSSELEFYLSSAGYYDYPNYIVSNFPVNEDEAYELQQRVVDEITNKFM